MFSLSGRVATGASDALDQVLERRMREALRLQQERQQAEQVSMERERMASADADRAADREYRQGQVERQDQQVARQDAQSLYARTDAGPISRESAAMFRKDPGLAPLVTSRKVIDARPITAPSMLAGAVTSDPAEGITSGGPSAAMPSQLGGDVTASVDRSGPQDFDVLEPTPQQAEKQLRTVNLKKYTGKLGSAVGEDARRAVAREALGDQIELPEGAVGATLSEREAAKRLDETRDRAYEEKEWSRRNNITFGQQQAAQKAIEDRQIAKETRAATPDPKIQNEQRMATIDAAKSLLTAPGLATLTGARGRAYLFGLLDDPMAGSEAATAKQFFTSLQSLLALPKLSYLKGPMSDKDIEFVKAAATSLNPNMSDEVFRSELGKIIFRLENPTGDVVNPLAPKGSHGGGMAPALGHAPTSSPGLKQSTLDILNARRGGKGS